MGCLDLQSPAEEAQNSVSGMDENGIHSKYLGLVRINNPVSLTCY